MHAPGVPVVTPFHLFEISRNEAIDLRASRFPSYVRAWAGIAPIELPPTGTHFGFVHAGPADLSCSVGLFRLQSGMYFAVPGATRLSGGAGVVITREGFHGFLHIGGPIEESGRLRYIDGCSDSLLIAPVMCGDPCLNLLHIPPNTHQTAHTHPSVRVGLVAQGSGECLVSAGRFALRAGLGFVIAPDSLHSFHTGSEPLLVVAYHPDSDFGPTDECHPMINRTIVSGTTRIA
jgi:hypothetical protein